MKEKILRRHFLKKGLALGGGMAILSNASRLKADQSPSTNAANETFKTIYGLRTIHGNFIEKNIPDDQILQIVNASVQAANSSNMQAYSIIVVKDREKMKNVCGYQGSCMLVFCADDNRIHASAKHLGHPYHSNTIVNFVTAGMNAMLAAQTAVIAAKSLGIDSLLTNGLHRGNMERVWKLLDLPEEYCFPMIALVLGYPTEEPAFNKGRLNGMGVIHHETYHPLSKEELDEIVKKYDDKTAHLGLNEEWNEQGFAHYQDWLYTAWLGGRSEPIKEETQMFKLLKRIGYVDLQK
jgi:nitroreductase